MFSRIPARVLLSLLVAILLAGCRTATDPAEPAARAEAVRSRSGGSCTVGISSDVGSFFEWFARRQHELEVTGLVFRPLAELDRESGEFRPVLARSWSYSDGGRVLDVALREDARWTDGVPVTSRDVAFTHELQTSRDVGWYARSDKAAIEAIETPDPRTVRFLFARAYADSLHDAVRGLIYPAHLLEDVPPAELAGHPFAAAPVGCGPFAVGRRRPGEALELVANDLYHEGRPHLDRIVFRVIADKESRALMLEDRELDLLRMASAEQFERLVASEEFRGYEVRTPKYMVLIWNVTDPVLAVPLVRRAMALALDRERMVELVQRGRGSVCPGPIPPDSWAYAADLPRLEHDPAAAAELLDRAGWRADSSGRRSKDGTSLRFDLGIVSGNRLYADTAALIQSDLARIGVEVRVRPREGGVFFDELYSGSGQASLITETAELKVDLTSLAHSSAIEEGSNYARYAGAEFDRVCEKARRAPDRETARPLWRRAEEILVEDQPYTFLYYRPSLHVLHRRFRDVEMDPNGLFSNLNRWWVPADERVR